MNIVDVCQIKYPGMVKSWHIMFGQDSETSPIRIVKWDVPNVPEPTVEELEAEIPQYQRQFDVETFKKNIDTKVSALLNSTAQSRGYSDSQSIVGYVNSTNTQWQAEAKAFIAWRDEVWALTFAAIELFESETGELPSIDDFIASLPEIAWPVL